MHTQYPSSLRKRRLAVTSRLFLAPSDPEDCELTLHAAVSDKLGCDNLATILYNCRLVHEQRSAQAQTVRY